MNTNQVFALLSEKVKGFAGNIQDIYTRLANLQSMYLFLSLWDCTTGLPYDNPREEEYEYKRGMFYIVADTVSANSKAVQAALKKAQNKPTKANIDALTKEVKKASKEESNDSLNYRPSGTSYIPNVPSTEQETQNVKPGDKYWYTGVSWQLMMNTGGEVAWENIVGSDPTQNEALAGVLDGKVNTTDATETAVAGTVAKRGTGGTIVTGTPTANTHASTKAYADQFLKMPTSGTQGQIQAVRFTDAETGEETEINFVKVGA